MEFLFLKYAPAGPNPLVFSPLDLYWNERDIEGDVNTDAGAQIRTACQVLASRGVCLESEDPYQPANFQTPPTPEQIAEAAQYKAPGYHRLNDLVDMVSCLASGYTFIMGFAVYESFESIGADGVMPMPGPDESVLGGHCVLVYGYDDTTQQLRVRNSWGASWGNGGNFLMPYEYAADSSKVFDAFIAHLGKPW
jgi:C1A family cysteine protease